MGESLSASALNNTADGVGLLSTCVQRLLTKDTELRSRLFAVHDSTCISYLCCNVQQAWLQLCLALLLSAVISLPLLLVWQIV
jgi:hypothetical protein